MSVLNEILLQHLEAIKESPDALGEILRKWTFVGHGLGCYSNFDVNPEFERVVVRFDEFRKIMGRPYNSDSVNSGWYDTDDKIMEHMIWYRHPNGIEMGYYWDGDGILCFYVPEIENDYYDGTISNDDCKKSYGWEFGTK